MEDRYSFAKRYDLSEDRIIEVSSGISPVGPSKKMRAAIRRAIKHIRHEPDESCRKLRRYAASRYGLPGDALCCANSLRELLGLIINVVRPKRILVSGPALPLYEEIVCAAGSELMYVPASDSWSAGDTEKIINHMDGVDLVLMASPNRVTGRVTGRDHIRKIISAAAGRKICVVLDESLMEFTDELQSFWGGLPGENLVVLRTTAYFYGMPGLELAYAAADPRIAETVQKLQASPPGILSVEAALAAFRDTAYRKEARKFVDRERSWLMKSLRNIKGISCADSDANVFLLRVENPPEGLIHSLCRAGFYIRDCRDINGIDPVLLRCSLLKHEKAVKFLKLLKGGLEQIRVAD